MSSIFFKKPDQQSKFEMMPIKIPVLNAYFNPISGEWIDYSDEEASKVAKDLNDKKSVLSKETKKLKKLVALRLINLQTAKKEICMILTDHKEDLERQGFEASDLIEKLSQSLNQ